MENNPCGADDGAKHTWKFFRSGGFAQVRLETADDLVHLDQLDQKLWSALSCPVHAVGMGFDTRTLELIDTDKDDRIRAPEILAATRFACSLLKNPGILTRGDERLPLDAIKDCSADGATVLASARRILSNMGKAEAQDIGIEELADTIKIFSALKLNGDGVLPPSSLDDPNLGKVVEDMIRCVGSETDRNGEQGINRAKLDAFFASAEAFAAWWAKAETDAANVFPLGEKTAEAFALLDTLRAKVIDYFTRCQMAAYDPRAAELMNRSEADLQALAAKDLSATSEDVAGFPLSRVKSAKHLPLVEGVNPAWAAPIGKFREEIVAPLLGSLSQITLEDWEAVNSRFGPYRAWLAEKQGAEVEPLGIARVREILSGNARSEISRTLADDEALKSEVDAIESVERLVRYHKNLFSLLNNFIAFRDFYSGKGKAIFQVGTLFLDGRSLDLCIRVEDIGKHSAMAGLSRTYLAYCECRRPGGDEKMTIVAAVTDGESDWLMVGRNGVFYDRMGRDWDATVVKLIEHPISIRQGFWAPYRRIGRMIGQQIDKFAAAREKSVHDASSKAVEGVAQGSDKAQPPPFDVAKFAGIFAAIGLAVGAIGTAVAALLTGFLGLTWWKMPIAMAGLVLIVSGPSMLIAALNLRHRSLAPLLDANGWAVNTRAKLNIAFGKSLTKLANLPKKMDKNLIDPFAEKSYTWVYWVALVFALAVAVLIWKFDLVKLWLEITS
jgi:hypothetical protein